jgi:hypothetical protein
MQLMGCISMEIKQDRTLFFRIVKRPGDDLDRCVHCPSWIGWPRVPGQTFLTESCYYPLIMYQRLLNFLWSGLPDGLGDNVIHRLNLERLNLEWDFYPNGLNPEWD